MAANFAIVDYDVENLGPPILTVEDAVKRSSFFDVPPYLYPRKVGDLPKGMDEADHKILSAKVFLSINAFVLVIIWTFLCVCICLFSLHLKMSKN